MNSDEPPSCPKKWDDYMFVRLDCADRIYGDSFFTMTALENKLVRNGVDIGQISGQLVTYYKKQLVALKILHEERSPNDGRKKLLRITEHGRQCLEKQRQKLRSLLTDKAKGLNIQATDS